MSEPDKGFYDAYNKGLGRATGDVIGFINSDDFYMHDGVIARVMELFADNPGIDAVHADLVYVREDDTDKIVRHWRSHDFSPAQLLRGLFPAHPTLFLRRGVYDRVGNFDTSFRQSGDVEFMFRVLYRFRTPALHVPELWVRMRKGGATGGNLRSILRQNREVRRGMAMNGMRTSPVVYWGQKLFDRSLQKLRAPFVRAPQG